MKSVDRFSLLELPPTPAGAHARRRLLLDGQPSSCVVWGDTLAAQYACDNFFLLVTHYDYFDGVNCWFHLLDQHGRLKDVVTTPDHFGFMLPAQAVTSCRLDFGFYDSTERWSLEVRPAGFWSFGKADLLARSGRFLFSKRFLQLNKYR
ncbi:hypothetical protein GJA_4142 [Janthinobacterium agaricidamnosum NBRC 102515 = DSM 9628]|uniref:Uncharacterized protein n=2 Tax=Janthinobacterium agaricidamnosum TaxID=55508 RepID=W0VBS8_9BURK|nr:hypothetical protein GJA_4142 [Janthinobacterium agaricidamnosum NBRC 102515 = DSM 9628]